MRHAPHRHGIFCIVGPQILRRIAASGTPAQRQLALDTLAVDSTMRLQRATQQLLAAAVVKAPAVGVAPAKHRTIYTVAGTANLPGTMVRKEGDAKTKDAAANEAYDGLGDTWDLYWEVFHRNSIDDAGLPLDGIVHYRKSYDNAFWDGTEMVFGDGDEEFFNRFTIAVDVIGHELTHGVTGAEANLTYTGQSGALNESISDVFGSLVKQRKLNQTAGQADWLIGEGLFTRSVQGVALRSMKNPGTAFDDPVLGKDPQPGTMAGYVHTQEDNGGVHTNSGIPNHAFCLLATHLGGHAWEQPGHIWYETVRDKTLKPTATFHQFAKRTFVNAGHLYGSGSNEAKAVAAAWGEVGIKVK